MRAFIAGVAVLVGAGAAAPLAAQDWKGMGRLEGRVLDPDGKPVEGAAVTLDLPERGGGGPTAKSDKKGRWAVGGIVGGSWNADINAAGYVLKKITIPLPSESARVPPIEVRLERAQPAGPAPELLAAVSKGDEAYKAGRYAEARAEYEKVLALKPELSATLHEMIARCFSQEGDHARAADHLQKVLDADPTNVKLKVLLAQEALSGGLVDRGMALLKELDDGSVTDPDVYYNVAVLLMNQRRTDDALPFLTKSVALDAKFVDGYFQRGLLLLGAGKAAEAKADFQKVLELAPPDSPQAQTARTALDQIK
jgi:tetratricopeptide (TPR) repeat protein